MKFFCVECDEESNEADDLCQPILNLKSRHPDFEMQDDEVERFFRYLDLAREAFPEDGPQEHTDTVIDALLYRREYLEHYKQTEATVAAARAKGKTDAQIAADMDKVQQELGVDTSDFTVEQHLAFIRELLELEDESPFDDNMDEESLEEAADYVREKALEDAVVATEAEVEQFVASLTSDDEVEDEVGTGLDIDDEEFVSPYGDGYDARHELYRVYTYSLENGDAAEVKVDDPEVVYTGQDGHHCIIDDEGIAHVVVSGFIRVNVVPRLGFTALGEKLEALDEAA